VGETGQGRAIRTARGWSVPLGPRGEGVVEDEGRGRRQDAGGVRGSCRTEGVVGLRGREEGGGGNGRPAGR